MTASIQTLIEEFEAINFQKDVLECRDMSILMARFAAFVQSAIRLQCRKQICEFSKRNDVLLVEAFRMTKRSSIYDVEVYDVDL